jgi:hypothetical protein
MQAASARRNLANAESGRGGKGFDLADDAPRDRRTSGMPFARLGRPHTGSYPLADQRGLRFGHGADDGEHGPAHGTVGVDLILDADEANAGMIELLRRCQQVLGAAAGPPCGLTGAIAAIPDHLETGVSGILPAFSTLDRVANRLRAAVHEQIYDRVAARLTAAHAAMLDALLTKPPNRTTTAFNELHEGSICRPY